jgi:hypothetical protein
MLTPRRWVEVFRVLGRPPAVAPSGVDTAQAASFLGAAGTEDVQKKLSRAGYVDGWVFPAMR